MIKREQDSIGNLFEAVATARRVAEQRGALGLMRWGRFTAAMGGVGGWEALTSPSSGSTASTTPPPRYIYTCRCGLIDLRHFYQLMYISLLTSEEGAVRRGVEHEEQAEPASRYAPEDITSNALGAEFGSHRSWFQSISTFITELESFLRRCDPVDWHALTQAQKDCIVNYYAVDCDGDRHRKQTAGGDGDPCHVCSGATGFPFNVDTESQNRITGGVE